VATHTELRCLHLCSGYGGFELGLRLAGIDARTVAHVERDSYAAAALVARMEEAHLDPAPIWDDLTTFDSGAWRGRVDCITAGFPCQPFSLAGSQRGIDDERWLWPAIKRIVREVGPRFVFLENVPELVRGGLPFVLADLADLGFDAEWGLHSAAEVGAPHKRERFWLLADTDRPRPERPSGLAVTTTPKLANATGSCGDTYGQWPPNREGDWPEYIAQGGPKPAIRRTTNGTPPELVESLHLGGNGLVPAVAAAAFVELLDRLSE
jgi:DNA (cytosine-5)-methyltransferase 1